LISVVIPVLNEKDNLVLLHNRLLKTLEIIGDSYEIIYVDDASTDGSWEIIKQLQNVRAIHFTRTFGQKAAIRAGLNKVVGDRIITMDSDLQNPPEEIPKLLKKLEEGYDVVFGVPDEKKHALYRKLGTLFGKYTMSKLLPSSMSSDWSEFRALSKIVVDELKLMSERNIFVDTILCWMGHRQISIKVEHNERYTGKSKYNFFKLIEVYLDVVVTLSELPLRLVIGGGIILSIIGILLALWYAISYFVMGFTVPGFATTAIFITFFSGIQLFCLGVMGEYIGRIHREVRHRPDYIIGREIG